MKCYYLKTSGSKLEIGKPYYVCISHDLGDTVLSGNKLSEDTFKFLMEHVFSGTDKNKSESLKKEIPNNLKYYVDNLPEGLEASLVDNGYIAPLIQILLKNIEKEYEKINSDSKHDYDYVYVVDIARYRIVPISVSSISSWNSISTFRTESDAMYALKIINDYVALLYGNKR